MPFPYHHFALLFSATCLTSQPIFAETVTQTWQGKTLNGNLQLAEDSALADGVFLITHGTLAHNEMELISSLQSALADEGKNSLAVNLSLSVDNRFGMYQCEVAHQHQHQDAVYELDQWLSWLQKQGSGDIYAVGHSRGGNQTAQFSQQQASVKGQILIAPMTWDAKEAATAYQQRYQQPLAPLLKEAQEMDSQAWLKDIGFLYCPNSQVRAGSFLSYYRDDAKRDTPALLREAVTPTLVISGSEDQTVKQLATRMASINNPNVSHYQVDGADHYFRDLYLDDIVEQILTFVDEQ